MTYDVAENLHSSRTDRGFGCRIGGFGFRVWFGIGLHFGLALVCMLVWTTKNWFACQFSVSVNWFGFKRIGLDARCSHEKMVWILVNLVCHWFA